jgi:putative endonuclease
MILYLSCPCTSSSRPEHCGFLQCEVERSLHFAGADDILHNHPMDKGGYVYILAGDSKRLYIGVTSGTEYRMWQHKNDIFPGSFTARYNIHRLVYFERFTDIRAAIAREKQLKRWSRIKKIQLIVASNPDWRDLSAEWGKPTEPFSGVLRPPTGF